jgi:hypothetical protein
VVGMKANLKKIIIMGTGVISGMTIDNIQGHGKTARWKEGYFYVARRQEI